ncbi:DNA repair protein [Marinobacter sp.]|uniref:DNA repair protein n=1 Tax=Marinobacter sp. TaxID=50741 RepID=UPI003569E5A6
MDNASPTAGEQSAVFFMDGAQVARQMRLSEFGAFLDGYVGLSDLAETDVRAVLVNLNPDLTVAALVFFIIWFDEEGRADSHWNVPIEALAKQGAKGPNLGGGPIRLVCRSQTPDSSLTEFLWDPDMTPGSNHFQSVRKAVAANALRFRKVEPEDENIPVLTSASPSETASEGNKERVRMAQMIREHRLRIKTLQSVQQDSLADLRREHRLEMQTLRSEMADLEQKYERMRLTNEQLKRRLSERNEQYLAMQESMRDGEARLGSDTKSVAELVLLREQMERKQRELELRDEKIVALEQENHELKHREPPEGSLLQHLRDQAVFLVAYHHGVGHITLPFEDIEDYFRNPLGYAAERCSMNEPAYKEWLEHYENPVCNYKDETGEVCGEPIMRITQPAEFQAGVDDRCGDHKA